MRATLERARRYARIIREDRVTQEELAAREGVSGPRVNQVLSFLRLDPSILGDLTDLTSVDLIPSMDELFAIGRLPSGRAQVARYRTVCATLKGQRACEQAEAARQRGFQHLFAQARGWQAALDAGTYRSLCELGRSEGLSAHGRPHAEGRKGDRAAGGRGGQACGVRGMVRGDARAGLERREGSGSGGNAEADVATELTGQATDH
ncbi:MAG: hypothetical protein RLZZ299_195 [Pseudomonadota bacterium]|jgi:hypothetical protein